jgi:hypothetical protein
MAKALAYYCVSTQQQYRSGSGIEVLDSCCGSEQLRHPLVSLNY